MIRKILVAFDGSEGALRAFDFATDLAARYSATVLALAVIRLPEPTTSLEVGALLDDARDHFESAFKGLLLRAATQGIELHTAIEVGHPVEHIVARAEKENFDLIVMGCHGKTAILRWMLGSVSDRVVRHAHCPVTVVK